MPASVLVAMPRFGSRFVFPRRAMLAIVALFACFVLVACASVNNGTTTPPPPDTTPPTAPTNLAATAASSTQINLSWTAATDNVGVIGYQIQRCQNATCSNFAQVGTTTTATTLNDTGLAASTSYSYRVSAKDAAGNTSTFSNTATASTPAGADTTPPSAPASLTATVASSTQINLSWTASTDNVGVTGYQIQRCQGAACASFAQVGTTTTALTFNDTTVVASNSYSYRVSAKDAAGNVSTFSNTATASTPAGADTTPPSAPTNLTATAASSTQINLAWTASTDNVGVTGYQIQRCQGAACASFAQVGTTTTATTFNDTTALASNSYTYRVSAKDAANNVSTFSNTASASTPASPDTTPPSAPTNLIATAASSTQINLAWTASTDNVGVTGYQVQRCQGAACASFAQVGTTTTALTFNDTIVVASTSYSYRVSASDAANNVSTFSNTASASTPAPPDTTPPSAPTNLTATAASSTQINLAWTASTDNVGVTGYQIQRCQGAACASFAQVGTTTTALTFNDTTALASNSYSYRVSAKDAAGNVSTFSNTATASTPAGADTTPPSAPTNLTATAASSTQINLAWTASTDNVGVTGYQIQRCQGAACASFAQVGTTTTALTFNDTTVVASTSYSYRVSASDAANNVSTFSNTATASTPAGGAAISVSITPRRGGLTLSQNLTFTASVQNDVGAAGVSWSSTGGGLFTNQTTTSALFVAPAVAGSVTVTATSSADITKSASAIIGVTDLTAVPTYQNDNQRTGQNLHEFALTPALVSSAGAFGKLFSCDTTEGGTVAGHIYAQPLYVANLTIGTAKHNVLFVVTESDWVYAFDADASPCVTLWKASMLDSASVPAHDPIPGESTVPAGDTGEPDDLHPEIGITSTPVIDTTTSTIYLTSKSKESSTAYHHRLHALDLGTGAEKLGGPVDVAPAGFNPLIHMQRPALLLNGSNIYLGFGSHGDQNDYHGWLIGYNKTTLAQSSVWTSADTTVIGTKGALWQAGSGPAVDLAGNIWVEVANGDFDGTISFGDSVVRLNTAATGVLDFFTPFDQDVLASADVDLGSGGVTILPSTVGPSGHPLAVATGKPDQLYVLDQTSLGHFNSTPPDNILQEITLPNGHNTTTVIAGMFSKTAYFNGRVYVLAINDFLRAYSVNATNPFLSPTNPATGADNFGFPGATPAISAQGSSNGIVWVLNTTNNNSGNGSGTLGPAQLFGYDATTLAKLFSSSASAGGANAGPNAVKFVVPTIANGKVYVAGQGGVTVFGLLP